MCIIAVKPKGAKLPSDETLRRMFDHNPDGAGFMFAVNGKVEIRKGFMTYEGFRQALSKACCTSKDDALVMHFRITTHGGTCAANTHPFPLTDDLDQMTSLSTSCDVGVAHNGIIKINPRSSTVSDTMEFIASVLYPVYRKNKTFYKVERIRKGITDCINGSRMVFLTGQGEVIRLGKWEQHDGCWFSNDSYKKYDRRWYQVPVCTQTRKSTDTDAYDTPTPVRLPWERDARLYVNLMPLARDEWVVDENGEVYYGDFAAIDKAKRVYWIDNENDMAYETYWELYKNVVYDRRKAQLYEIA